MFEYQLRKAATPEDASDSKRERVMANAGLVTRRDEQGAVRRGWFSPATFRGTSLDQRLISSTGSSGVAHLACAYGVPIVCADLEDFRQMSDGEGMAIEFYKPGDASDLANCLIRLLTDPAKQQAMAEQNFSAALRMTMPNVVLKYLRHFELEQRTVALRQITRFRKLPSWVPSKSFLLRLMTRGSLGWVHRSALHRPSARPTRNNQLLNDDVHRGGEFAGTRTAIDRNGIAGRSGTGGGSASGFSSTRGSDHPDADESAQGERLSSTLARPFAQETEAHEPEGQQPAGIDGTKPAAFGYVHPRDRISGNGKNGSGGASPGSNGSGGERASQTRGDAPARQRDGRVERS